MRMSLAGGAAVAAVVVALLLIPTQSVSPAFALGPVVSGLENSPGLHLIGAVRSREGEAFDFVSPESPLQRKELWIQTGPHGPVRYRMEKPDRIITFDGKRTLFYNVATGEFRQFSGGRVPEPYLDPEHWLRNLMDRDPGTVDLEIREVSGTGVVHATVRETAVPVSGRPPSFWVEFDRRTEIRWDGETNRLLGLERYVAAGPREILVAEVGTVEYFDRLDEEIFRLELPPGSRPIEIPVADLSFDRIGPGEVARVFWEAAIDGNWDRLRVFCPYPSVVDWLKENRPAEIVSLGEPFQTGGYPGWYVPYAVRLREGKVLEHRLALRNDNAFGRFVFDGGI